MSAFGPKQTCAAALHMSASNFTTTACTELTGEKMKSKLIKALTIGVATGVFFVGVPHAEAKEKKKPTATAENCPLPFCATNPGKSCTTISDPNLSYFCGTQENKPFRTEAVKRAAAKGKKKTTATAEICPLPFCTTNPGKSCTTISDPNLSYFCGTQENKPFRKQ